MPQARPLGPVGTRRQPPSPRSSHDGSGLPPLRAAQAAQLRYSHGAGRGEKAWSASLAAAGSDQLDEGLCVEKVVIDPSQSHGGTNSKVVSYCFGYLTQPLAHASLPRVPNHFWQQKIAEAPSPSPSCRFQKRRVRPSPWRQLPSS